MIINPRVEMLPGPQRQDIINQRFEKNLKWAKAKSPYFRELLQSIKDLTPISPAWEALPLTTAETLTSLTPYDLLTGPLSTTLRLVKTPAGRYHAFTQEDISRNLDITIRTLGAAEINKTSIVALNGDYTTQGILDLHYATEALGATVIPSNSLEALTSILIDFNPNVLIATASIIEKIIGTENCPPRLVILDTSYPEALITKVKQDFPDQAYNYVYMEPFTGITGLIFTCEQQHLHVQEDYALAEVVAKELVLTPLTLEAMPLIKLATGLNFNLTTEGPSCSCGRSFATIK